MHCTAAVCAWVCPSYARGYDTTGAVTIDRERCIGCGRCEEYCPFDVPRLGEENVSPRLPVELGVPRAIAYKCNFCKDRLEEGLIPACAKTCPPKAIQFGERADLVEQGRARVKALKATYPKAYLYGEDELRGLHVLYILTEEPGIHGLPQKPEVGTYPEFNKYTFPDWYAQAIADGELPPFPDEARPEWYMQPRLVPTPSPGEPARPPAPARLGVGWPMQVLFGWLGVGVIGGLAALLWTNRRKRKLAEQESKEG